MNPLKPVNEHAPRVFFPEFLLESDYCGSILGYYHANTSVFNIICTDEVRNTALAGANAIGQIINIDENGVFFKPTRNIEYAGQEKEVVHFVEKPSLGQTQILGIRKGKNIDFFTSKGVKCESEPYSLINDVFSRNTNILETSLMLEKTVIISGCGSVGSLVALELARAGVGKFLLVDYDLVSYHNICRHQCSITDVGKYKIDAIEERILQINPTAQIGKSYSIIEEVPEKTFLEFCSKNSIIIGCADNREGDLYANFISKLYKIPFLSIGFWERAFAGEIFYTLPNGMPCYKCFYEEIGVVIERPANRKYYTNEKHLEKLNFEPGISVDINFVTTIAIKLAIDILNIGNESYIPKVIDHLDQFTLVCNTIDERIGGEQSEYFSYPLQVRKGIDIIYCSKCLEKEFCVLVTE